MQGSEGHSLQIFGVLSIEVFYKNVSNEINHLNSLGYFNGVERDFLITFNISKSFPVIFYINNKVDGSNLSGSGQHAQNLI